MPIEKIPNCFFEYPLAINTAMLIGDKINELIDFINTREQDRSEQMARVISKIDDLKEEQESMHRVHDIHMDRTVDTMTDHRIRIEKLERNETQPKEEEILACPFCGSSDIEFYNFGQGCDSWRASCLNCDTFCQNKQTKQEAIEAWNKRA